MSEEAAVVVEEVPIDTVNLADFKKARAEGKSAIERQVDPAEAKTDDEQEKPKPKGGFQKRIDRLVKHNAVLEEKIAQLESRAPGEKQKEQAATTDGEPKREQFENDLAYYRALMRYEAKQELKLERETEQREASKQRETEIVKSYNERVVEAKSRYDDWADVVTQDVEIPAAVGHAIMRMPNGPDVAYQIGSDPEARAKLMEMDPLEAVGEAWRISDRLKSSAKEEHEEQEIEVEEQPKKPQSKAPIPIKPVGTGNTRSSVPLDKVTSLREYKAARKAGRVR